MIVDPLFNPASKDFIQNPYPTYARLREEAPIYYSAHGYWLISRFQDVAAILSDKRFGKHFGDTLVAKFGEGIYQEPIVKLANKMMLSQNLPQHKKPRQLAVQAFNSKRIQNLRSIIQKLVNQLLNEIKDYNKIDLMQALAYPLPLLVISELVGINLDEQAQFRKNVPLLSTLGRMFDLGSLTRQDLNELNNHALILIEYFSDLCKERINKPKDDLISQFVLIEQQGELDHDTVIANLILLFLAGYETTAKFICNALLVLHQHGEQLELLKTDISLLPNALKEVMRFESPLQITARVALEEVEFNGFKIKQFDNIIPLVGAAHRDPEVFANPDVFDIRRNIKSLLSFGGGIHLCPGEQLAYLEAEIVISTLLEVFPNMQLYDCFNPAWDEKNALRSPKHLIAKLS